MTVEQAEYVKRRLAELAHVESVMGVMWAADIREYLLWHLQDARLHLSMLCSDVFAWGCADSEPITVETFDVLSKAYLELKDLGATEWLPELYCARVRKMRPQGAAYPCHQSGPYWQAVMVLLDECGPEREVGLGNPRKPPRPDDVCKECSHVREHHDGSKCRHCDVEKKDPVHQFVKESHGTEDTATGTR